MCSRFADGAVGLRVVVWFLVALLVLAVLLRLLLRPLADLGLDAAMVIAAFIR